MEMCDAMIITKADGNNASNATRAQSEYSSALHLFPAREDGWFPPVLTTSAIERKGIDEVVQLLQRYTSWTADRGLLEERRKKQNLAWLHEELRLRIIDRFYHSPNVISKLKDLELGVAEGRISPFQAATLLLGESE
jgi:LAO/AO transport system kinase